MAVRPRKPRKPTVGEIRWSAGMGGRIMIDLLDGDGQHIAVVVVPNLVRLRPESLVPRPEPWELLRVTTLLIGPLGISGVADGGLPAHVPAADREHPDL